ncbi:alpha/beta hydrolase family protein [Hydrogenophaga pseudoflava]|uniref:alpha/beta hydrolase family protein n=1 Tax=Hydrogenophaga pseudoflava TaxID=47421 RepID=UPI0027E51CF4|nr:Ig-like domain-containing protein [Hydrogenophaga pseudoflava]MDQ7746810.1 Ig-like domain-containing protein [Hydrogenophaga pseudoflava]
MTPFHARPVAVVLSLALIAVAAGAQTVSVRDDDTASPFPSNRHTVLDFGNATFRRVHLPRPDCAVRVSDCQDIDVINTLDGFSTQPRITVPFTGDIDVNSVSSETVFLFNLGDTQSLRGFGQKVGINQVLWDPATRTLVFEPDELLTERSRYVLVVTNGVRDARGRRIVPGAAQGGGRDGAEHHREMREGASAARVGRGLAVAAASVFTTQSATGDLVKVMRRIKSTTPAPVDFMIGSASGAPVRAVFPLAGIAAVDLQRQVGAAPGALVPQAVPLAALFAAGNTVGQLAYGRFQSPNYLAAGQYIPPTPTLLGRPQPQGTNELVFQLFLPAGAKPAAGWPVAIFGHGFTDSMFGAPWTVASVLASRGIATLSINVVGHGGGAAGVLNLSTAGGVVSVPAGGRGFDQDGNGAIDSTEGSSAAPPRSAISSRDGLRQTAIDLMQLVRQIETGVDVDGDGSADLDAQRIYYAGQSFGGIYGTLLLGVEPSIQAGVPNVPGGSIAEVARLGAFRGLTGFALATRVPQLLNLPPSTSLPVPFNFFENMPLRDQPPGVNNVPGAMEIAQVIDRWEWVQQAGNPVSYAHLIRQQPLPGSAAKPVILQMAKGDQTVPNPTSTAIVRAGGLQAQTTYFRNDLAVAANPAVPKNPHTFLTGLASPAGPTIAVLAQVQIAEFFRSGGSLVIDPDGPGPLFEVPLVPPLPEGLNFLP